MLPKMLQPDLSQRVCVDLSFLVKTTDCEQLPSLNVYIYSVTVYSLDLHIVTPPVLELWTVIRTEQVLRSTLYST